MITKSVKYEDYNGKTVVKDFDFHLNKAELAEIQFREDGSTFDDVIIKISKDETNIRSVLDMIKEIVVASVGRKVTEDGVELFVKDDKARNALVQTDAYSELLFELISDPQTVAEFVKGLLPSNLAKEYNKALSSDDINEMTPEEMKARLAELRGDN